MPWVPIEESGIEFTFVPYAEFGGVATLTDSVALNDRGTPPSGGPIAQWSLKFSNDDSEREPVLLRLTALSFAASGPLTGFEWDGETPGQQTNESATPEASWGPSPFEATITFSGGGEFLTLTNNPFGEWAAQTSQFLIEVWEEGPPVEINYNCECDDPNPSQTLAQLRTRLMRRLGFSAMTSTPPPGMADLLNDFLQSAQEYLYRTYRVLRTERFYTWQMVEGARYYDLDANQDVCTKKLDPRMITWVGVSSSDEWWQPLICGIPPEYYSWNSVQGWPERYEIRQCIEVWPAPDGNNWKLRIKGHFGLEPFDQDDDKTTIDSEAVFLFSLARAKAHYGQPDAANYQTDAMNYIRNLTAGAHMTRRYVPGSRVEPNPIPPKWLPLGDAPP